MYPKKHSRFAEARGRFAYERRPAIAYSRIGTARILSAVPSSSNFPASHLGSEFGSIARSYSIFITVNTRALKRPDPPYPIRRAGACHDAQRKACGK
jgi:hypothetical protein